MCEVLNIKNKTIKILGHNYNIVIQKDYIIETDGETGKCNNYNNTIYIAEEQPESAKRDVLLHEIIEAINYRLELNLEHHQICALGEVLNQVLAENAIFATLKSNFPHPK